MSVVLEAEHFIDFYELLDVWPDADPAQLRQAISSLYLEARENLEHQNHRKRFYYRELYEIHLPHARQILLDKKNRSEYDEQLRAYRAERGEPSTPSKPRDNQRSRLDNLPGAAPAVEEDPFAEFADLEEDVPLPPILRALRMDPEVVERRRDNKRRELIKHELIAQGMTWGVVGAMAVFFLLGAVLFAISLIFELRMPLFLVLSILGIAIVAAIAGRQSMRWAKRRIIGVLSQMPYDELLRHCGR